MGAAPGPRGPVAGSVLVTYQAKPPSPRGFKGKEFVFGVVIVLVILHEDEVVKLLLESFGSNRSSAFV